MSILNDVKKMLGIEPEYTHFDRDIIMHINGVFMILADLGVYSDTGEPFNIVTGEETWIDFHEDANLALLRPYMFMKVKMMFDPPTMGSTKDAYEKQIAEFEFRLQTENELSGPIPEIDEGFTPEQMAELIDIIDGPDWGDA